MNIRKIIKYALTIVLIVAVIAPVISSAYHLLEPLPQGSGYIEDIEAGGNTHFTDYLKWVFNFTLVAVAFLSVLYIAWGGLLMMTAGASEGNYGKGKTYIEESIWGIIIAVSGYLILYIINPNLVNMQLEIPKITCHDSGGEVVPCAQLSFGSQEDICSDYSDKTTCQENSKYGCVWKENLCVRQSSDVCLSFGSENQCPSGCRWDPINLKCLVGSLPNCTSADESTCDFLYSHNRGCRWSDVGDGHDKHCLNWNDGDPWPFLRCEDRDNSQCSLQDELERCVWDGSPDSGECKTQDPSV